MRSARLALLLFVLALVAGACGSEGNVFSMEVGMCFDDVSDELVSDVPRQDCDAPHDNEVFALYDVTDSSLPDRQTMLEGCADRFEAAIGSSYAESIYYLNALTPSDQSWDQGDREVICYGFIPDEKLNTSILGSGR
jgi:hypothetical protein